MPSYIYGLALMGPMRFFLQQPIMTGKVAKWIMMLSKFDLHYIAKMYIKGMVVSDFLAN